MIRKLERHKVDTRYMRKVKNGMGTWLAVFDQDGDVVASISKRPDHRPIEQILDEQIQKYQPLYRKKKPLDFLKSWIEDMQLQENEAMKMLVSSSVFYKAMPEFLRNFELGVESDLRRCGDRNYTAGAVRIMTLHGSKGLEFPVVIICGTEKGCIPLESESYSVDISEEKRLLYVGMTRAKRRADPDVFRRGITFLAEVGESVIQREQGRIRSREENYHQMTLFEEGL